MRKAEEIAPDVYRLGNNYFNFYLIKQEKHFLLIDSGMLGFWNQLKRTIEELGGCVEDIQAILITHAHLDHIGLANKLNTEYGTPIYISSLEEPRFRKGGAQVPPMGLFLKIYRRFPLLMLLTATYNRVFWSKPISSFTDLHGINNLPELIGKPHVFHVPGHTPGSLIFWFPERKILFTGDSLVTIDMLTSRNPVPQLTLRRTNDDREQAVSSLEAFMDFHNGIVLSGHGDPWYGNIGSAITSLVFSEEKQKMKN